MEKNNQLNSMNNHVNTSKSNDLPVAKRRRRTLNSENPRIRTTMSCSCEEFLSVPLSIIFRQVHVSQNKKPLLTRAEAQTFLRVGDLARELDLLQLLASRALECQLTSRHIQTHVVCNSLTLRSLVPILKVHGVLIANETLHHVEVEIDRILGAMEICAMALKQFSEQNWIMSDSFLDAFGGSSAAGSTSSDPAISPAHLLANEKRILSDLQEEISKRLDHMTTMNEEGNIFDDYINEDDLCLESLCNRLFKIDATQPIPQVQEESDNEADCKQPRKLNFPESNLDDRQKDSTTNQAQASCDESQRHLEKTLHSVDLTMNDCKSQASSASAVSQRKNEAARILATMDDLEPEEPTSDSCVVVNTQMAVTTLVGLTSSSSAGGPNFS